MSGSFARLGANQRMGMMTCMRPKRTVRRADASCMKNMAQKKKPTTRSGGAQFFVNGVPVGGRRRRQAAQPGEDAEGEGQQINLPPFVQAVLQTVPPPLLVMMFFAFFMVFMQVMGAVMTVVMARMHLIMPIMWFAPDRMKIPLILSVFLLSVLGMM